MQSLKVAQLQGIKLTRYFATLPPCHLATLQPASIITLPPAQGTVQKGIVPLYTFPHFPKARWLGGSRLLNWLHRSKTQQDQT
ncbi:MAG: hypothetical protein IAF02_25495 [Anaerolineae bacterium]|nr:hypothetical protein [Anaerolineae bacterium]